ncbi:PhzF family phenazine biosynthesis protein [Acetobacter ghanensis]|uniref:PhzF family phenazine biosynthesis isomerase n=1 Tax=Acetobacter ghanensis TaxID=431306 RepID=A0A0U5F4U9_9PROT|nr:PhzF family phenazine biosynthesis protein [Acetobacter ghanensis]NHO39332.1 PhzF family phenazine biosynthesis isomerase [Acetobacter ghanensis]GBQ47756.1 phenazine biosynthesis PhzC/PhzF protein [Acetobacter ghanensis DSM 18895]CEF54363.1 PhzF family phenazine biosynthesis protein [Acetobacter ghanensis]
MQRTYKVVDVFTKMPFAGNPVAVVLDAQGLDTQTMQAIARWTNLSETTFLLPAQNAEADYQLRIFTPRNELPFAGHPTLGSAHAALEAGRATPRQGQLVQECGVGLVTLNVSGSGKDRSLSFTLPPARHAELDEADIEDLEAILGAPVDRTARPMMVDVGPVWVVARLKSVEQLLALRPDFGRSQVFEHRLGATGISVFATHGHDDADIEVRSFAASQGVNEDPVCGSGNGSVAVFRHVQGLLPPGQAHYLATQGGCVGRNGRVSVCVGVDGAVDVGGQCVTTVEGRLAG